MDISAILTQLKEERDRIDGAITALERMDGRKAGRAGLVRKRVMSSEARAKIAAAARKRWATARKKGKNSLAS